MESPVSEIANDVIAFKMSTARRFLDKIPNTIPRERTDLLMLEVHAEAFLFFSASAIDVVKREINEKFQVFDKENVFYIYGFMKHLSNRGMQVRIKKAISEQFTTPTLKNKKTITTKSGLWKLQSLRNQATHGQIVRIVKGRLCLSYTIRDLQKQYRITQMFEETTDMPHRYFEDMFEDLCDFISNVRRITRGNAKYRIKIPGLEI